MDEINEAFLEYLEEFRKLSKELKQKEILRSIKEMVAIFDELGKIDNISLKHLSVNEALDTNSKDTDNYFLEREFIYLENAKNLIGQYLDNKY